MRSLGRFASFLALLSLSAATPVPAQIDARMLRFPDVSETQIAFVYAGDIWLVEREGGAARRLSTPPGEESFPRFSPDGSELAFSANYDGNLDAYVMPVAGGVPRRLTHHPAPDRVLGWSPDGRSVLIASPMTAETNRYRQLFTVSAEGGLPKRLPVPYGEFGSISPDGKTLAYMRISRDFRTWKRYRGGMAPDIWLFDLEELSSRNLTDDAANDAQPMWHGGSLYFLSDRDENQRANIWVHEPGAEGFRQITFFSEYDVRFPSMGPGVIVLENAGSLFLLDLESEELREVEVEVVTDRATLKPRHRKIGDLIFSADVSPTGKRAVFSARGELLTVPAEHGVIRNLTRSSDFAERHPAWSPDGKWIAYFSDRSGEYELTLRAAEGGGEERTVTTLGPGYRYQPHWSPDSKKLAFIDQTQTIQIVDVVSGEVERVDQGLWMHQGARARFTVSWSADSRWMAYHRGLENRNLALFLYDTKEKSSHQVTAGFYSDSYPAFDPEGKYLYCLSDRRFSPSYSDLDNTWIYANTTQIAAIPLRSELPSPLAPRNDDEEGEEEDGTGEEKDAGEKKSSKGKNGKDESDEKTEEPEPVEIDLEGFEERLVVLPPEAGNYLDLAAAEGKVIYRRLPRSGSGEDAAAIVYWDLEEREEKTVLGEAGGYALSADRKKLLVAKGGGFFIVDLAPEQKTDKPLRTGELETVVDPVAEWRQIFNDAWRLERDFFYDPQLHQVDWEAMRERYGALLPYAVTRWDLNFIIGELIAELSASHAYRGGGDVEPSRELPVGLLGVDFELHGGAYRIVHILDGAPWDNEVRSPLRLPGVDAREGDYLLAVNGVPLDTSVDPWAAFQGLAGKEVFLTLNDEPHLEGAREVLVETLGSEGRLRNLAWIERNRKKVLEATEGRVGYVYVPSTGVDGQTELVRQFMAQFAMDGLIIDERFNSGGQIPDRFVELLNRPLYNYWGVRDGKDWPWPPVAHNGPKVMLINGWSGSGGDAFPFYFREAGLGPLIGERTWGGLIGISGAPAIIDGGRVTVPTFGMYSREGEWIIEGHGVDPDLEVIADPALMVDGGDPQLEAAIAEILRLLEAEPPLEPGKPEYPDRSGR